ncbi:FAD-linked oxidase C-terminal domain-containing protein [Pseudokineococcus marinus]|uniref:FAD-binding oxidoreductase n=1 Tax=Pseudokineococcus marinus TaxID=351215 RepID=UPI002ADE9262|nr:FAD-linked oxidase C-terminal domain-containing protein [Pseudokineococcus marinus]
MAVHDGDPGPQVLVDRASREAASTDWSGHRPAGLPDGVVRARSTEDVVAVLRRATAERTPVVTRGAGTGLAGAASATTGELVLDVSGMDRVLDLRVDDQVAVVEPGVLVADLDAAAAEHGLMYAPDPASAALASVGGSIATNAGGLRCAKHGATREAVLGLRVVLADGRVLRTGRATTKGVAGYDLTALLVGSEGTLGVVVEATLRLRPRPRQQATTSAFFADVAAAARAAVAVTRAGVQPAVLELVDAATLEAVDAARGTDLRARGAALLLAQTDGEGAAAEAEAVLAAVSAEALEAETTTDPARAAELMTARREALPALQRLGQAVIEDVAVPRSRLADAVTGVEEVSRRTGVRIAVFAHAGDGNLHPVLVVPEGEDVLSGAPWDAACQVFALAQRLGGTLTGEHGVGLLKRAWLREELGDVSMDVHAAVKAAFDPLGILNPGKAVVDG